jgi:hypothetical protein
MDGAFVTGRILARYGRPVLRRGRRRGRGETDSVRDSLGPRYKQRSSGAKNVTVLALIAVVIVLALVVLGVVYLIQLVL